MKLRKFPTMDFSRSWLMHEVAHDSYNRNVGDSTHQVVAINLQGQMATIHNYNGRNGYDAVWDYSMGLFATRLFQKRVCVVAMMDWETFPELEALGYFKGQKLAKDTPQVHHLKFLIGKTHVQNTGQFGGAIEQLCRGIPTYYASQEEGADLLILSSTCTSAGIQHYLGIYLCGNIPSC
ncbi:gastrokine-1-like isoform X2 [Hemicordylus capensis]|uniref:gastrokine-1-like isoform X2 n=1 Tax=Hemicordylus capensis TaxID=884348 RepID=UPI00230482B9|nr:gastrokine-1-like isoform X2 [Hemicordylus capensis]